MFLKKKKKEKREGRKKRDGQVWSVGKGESLSLLTGWPFKMTEVRVISVQLVQAWYVYVLACPPAAMCVWVVVKLSGDGLLVSITCTYVTL